MDEQDEKLYAISVDYIYDILDESVEQVDMAKKFLPEILDRIDLSEDVLFNTAEILYSNLALTRLTEKEIETAARRPNPEHDDEEFVITAQIFQALQTLLMSRYHAIVALNKMSFSLMLH